MSDNGKLRVGVVGAGVMGERHARVYSELPGAKLVGVYDVDAGRAIDVVRTYGGDAYSTLEDLYRSVDAVTIASPTTNHSAAALAAMDHGLHVLIEKPLAATLEESQAIVDHAGRHRNQVVMVGHLERFNPTIVALRAQLVDQPIVSIMTRRMSPFGNRSLDTDVVHDLMIHDIDLALDLLGDDVESVDAIGSPVRTAFIDQAMAHFAMQDGAEVNLIASRVANRKVRSIEVRTAENRIIADLLGKTVEVRAESGHRGGDHQTRQVAVSPAEPLKVEVQHFIDCINGRATPCSDVHAGYRAMAYAASINALIEPAVSVAFESTAVLQTGD